MFRKCCPVNSSVLWQHNSLSGTQPGENNGLEKHEKTEIMKKMLNAMDRLNNKKNKQTYLWSRGVIHHSSFTLHDTSPTFKKQDMMMISTLKRNYLNIEGIVRTYTAYNWMKNNPEKALLHASEGPVSS